MLPSRLGLYNTSTALLQGVGPPKQSGGEIPVMQKLWDMRSTLSLPSLSGPLWPGVVAPARTLYMG